MIETPLASGLRHARRKAFRVPPDFRSFPFCRKFLALEATETRAKRAGAL